jgi:Flp pilus assembly protein TadG
MSVRRGASRSRRGQSMVEFALVAPIFFLLLFGIIEAGRFMYHYEILNNAAREGIRYAIIHGENSSDPTGPPTDATGADIKQAISDAALGLVGAGDLVIPDPVYSGPNGATNKRGSNVELSVSYTYSPLLPLFPNVTISTEASGVINN